MGSAFLYLNFLIKDETSSRKGSLSDEKDVDFYNFTIPFLNFQRNYFGVEVYIDMPEGCDYDLTLYDRYGNQVGKAEWDGEGRKKVTVPNWDINTNQYCLKVEKESFINRRDKGYGFTTLQNAGTLRQRLHDGMLHKSIVLDSAA